MSADTAAGPRTPAAGRHGERRAGAAERDLSGLWR